MIPLRDHTPSGKKPLITYLLILVNVLVFIYISSLSEDNLNTFIDQYALIPLTIFRGRDFFSLFSSVFIHGSWGHLLGNMLFLNIFGDNLEGKLGHLKYLLYYLTCGLGAAILQILTGPGSTIPMLGASGAIAGIMGGYLLLFPRNQIDVLFIFGYIIRTITVPAYLMLFYWFLAQLFTGVGGLAVTGADLGGIAYFAHIGGFLTGYLLLLPFKRRFI